MTIKLYSKLTPVNSKFNFANKNYIKTAFSRKITKPSTGSGTYSGMTMSYNFNSVIATVIFNGVTISGNAGNSGNGRFSSAGGTYTITNNNGLCGGVNGGAGGAGQNGGGQAGGGGAVGGNVGSLGSAGGAAFTDFSGFLAAYAAAGYTAGGGFGKGGGGDSGSGNPVAGNIPGSGGGGGTINISGRSGGNGMILIQYTVNGTNNYRLVNQVDGAGSITFPTGTSYVKAWAIGRGGDGASGYGAFDTGIYYSGAGGSGAGAAYCIFV